MPSEMWEKKKESSFERTARESVSLGNRAHDKVNWTLRAKKGMWRAM